jgi:hypothetical protein
MPTRAGYSYTGTVAWGDGSVQSFTASDNSLWTHVYAVSGDYQIIVSGTFEGIYFNTGVSATKLRSIDNWGSVGMIVGDRAFYGCSNLTAISSDAGVSWLNALDDGSNMFRSSGITSLPLAVTFASLTNGSNMFQSSSIALLPSGMNLSSLTTGTSMFFSTPLGSLPSGMTLSSLTAGGNMLRSTSLTSLPSGMNFASLTVGTNILNGVTISTSTYSTMLVNMESVNASSGVTFHGGSSKYNATGATARSALVSRSWSITDGGAA